MKKKIIIISSILGVLLVVMIVVLIGFFIGINHRNENKEVAANIVEESKTEELLEVESMITEENTVEAESLIEESSVVETTGKEESSVEVEVTTEEESSVSDLLASDVSNLNNEYITKKVDGKYTFTEDFYTMVLNHPFFQDASVSEVETFFNENPDVLIWIEIGDIDMFNTDLDWHYQTKGQPYMDVVEQPAVEQKKPATVTKPAEPSQSEVSQSQPATNPGTSQDSYDPFENAPGAYFDGNDNLGDGGNLVGDVMLN